MAITKYPTGATTYSLTLTADAAANTKGAYTQIVAATTETARGLVVAILGSNNTAGAQYLIDIATGAAASEVVVVANLPYAASSSNNTNCPAIFVPLSIASGTRLSARVQCSTGGATASIAVYVVGGTCSATAETYGADTSTSKATTVDPGGSANTKGSYVQLTAATAADIDWMVVLVTGLGNTLPSTSTFQFDIATGAASSEVVQIPDIGFSVAQSPDTFLPNVWSFPLSVPAGTRLSARGMASIIDATDRLFGVVVLGITNSGMNGGGGGGTGGAYAFIG